MVTHDLLLFQVIYFCLFSAKPLSEPKMTYCLLNLNEQTQEKFIALKYYINIGTPNCMYGDLGFKGVAFRI